MDPTPGVKSEDPCLTAGPPHDATIQVVIFNVLSCLTAMYHTGDTPFHTISQFIGLINSAPLFDYPAQRPLAYVGTLTMSSTTNKNIQHFAS